MFSYVFQLSCINEQARNPGTVEKRIANSDGRTDGLTNGGEGRGGEEGREEEGRGGKGSEG